MTATQDRPVAPGGEAGATGRTITIVVLGQPAPQGSKSPKGRTKTGRVIMVESSKKVRPWREAVKAACANLDPQPAAVLGALQLEVTFTFHRPKHHRRTGRNAHLLRDNAPARPCGPPDGSKLVRATEDALTDAGVWRDDALVADGIWHKVYAGSGLYDALDRPGAVIHITPLDAP